MGLIATEVDTRVGEKFMSPNFTAWLGTDRLGRDILSRVIYANKIAFVVGLVTATLSVLLGTVLGAVSGFFGGWVDAFVVWLYSTVESIPYLLLLIAISYITGTGLSGVYLAFVLTFWVAPCRVIRGEVLKLKEADFVIAARAMGYGPLRILFRHVVPNTVHLSLVNFTLIFVAAIKSEVILSYLGLGVQGEPSWGTMIDQARAELVNGFFWQIGGATVCAEAGAEVVRQGRHGQQGAADKVEATAGADAGEGIWDLAAAAEEAGRRARGQRVC